MPDVGTHSMLPGLLTMSATDYHRDPCDTPSLSSTIARILCTQSPAHARAAHPKLNPLHVETSEQKYDVGTVAHALLLEGREAVQVVDAPDWRTKDARALRDAARENGQIPLLASNWDEVQAMVAATRQQLDAINVSPPLFTDGHPEQTIVWDENGVTCRARLDWLRDDHTAVDDYKTTTRSAEPGAFSRSLFGMGYDVQAAMYLRGLKAVTGVEAEWRWVVQETFAPYALSVVSLAPDAWALANEKVQYAIDLWRDCLEHDRWPAYTPLVAYAEAPAWELVRWMERAA